MIKRSVMENCQARCGTEQKEEKTSKPYRSLLDTRGFVELDFPKPQGNVYINIEWLGVPTDYYTGNQDMFSETYLEKGGIKNQAYAAQSTEVINNSMVIIRQ